MNINPSRLTGAIALLAATTLPGWAQDTVTIPLTRDTTIFEEDGTLSNGAGDHIFVGSTNNGSLRRALIAFDDLSAIPEGATITSATVFLNMNRTIADAVDIRMHRVLGQWGEAGSNAGGQEGGGDAAESGDATWSFRMFDADNWTTEGGDFDATTSASTSVDDTGEYAFESTPEMLEDLNLWHTNPDMNFGWILVADEDAAAPTAKRFGSRENSSPSNQPRLEVTFEGEAGGGIPINFGHSGGWFNRDTSGQGILIEVLPDSARVFLAWFTYEEQPQKVGSEDHRWLTGLGDIDGNRVEIDLTVTSGGFFDDPTDVERTQAGEVGTVTLEFESCSEGTMAYTLTDSGRSNTFPIGRLGPAPQVCLDLESQ